MREKLNSNPLMQLAVVGLLLVAAGFFVLSSMGGGHGAESESGESAAASTGTASSPTGEGGTTVATGTSAAAPLASGSTSGEVAGSVSATGPSAAPMPGSAPPPPQPVLAAWEADKTIALLFVRPGGIDDRLVSAATRQLTGMSGVASFIVPAAQISRYAAITEGVGVNRVPALVVVRPKRLDHSAPTASVTYGFQSAESIVQAVKDAGYKGPTLEYHP